MKKLLSIVMIFMLAIGAVSCSKNLEDMNMDELVAAAKADGANWSVDQWKSATKGMMKNMKPMVEKMVELQKEVEDNPDKALEMLGKMQEELKQYEGLEKQIKEFQKLAEESENGKAMIADEEWGKQMLKEMGLPEDAL